MRVEQGRDLCKQVLPRLGVERGDEAHRGDACQHDIAPGRPAMRPRLQLEWRERRIGVEAAAPVAGAVARRVAGARVEDAREVAHPVDALVAPVPDQGDGAPGAQDARDLGCGVLGIEPVERLRGDDRVDAGAGDGHGLGDCVEHLRARDLPGKHAAHARDRLERKHARAAGDERAGELARAGPELQQCASRRGAREREDGLDRRGRIGRPSGLVGVRGAVEADRGRPVDVAPHARRSGTGSPGSSSIAR